MGIPQRERVIEAKIDFVNKALTYEEYTKIIKQYGELFVNPSYTIKASWFVEEGKCIFIDRVVTMHPYDYVLTYSSLTKDWDKALTHLKKRRV